MVVARILLVLVCSSALVAGDDVQLLCFGAKWCQPCREMQPVLDRLASEGFPIQKVDVEQAGQLATRYQIQSVPSLVLVDRQGNVIDQLRQATDYDTLRRFFAHHRIAPQVPTVRGQSPQTPASPDLTAPSAPASHSGPSQPAANMSLAATVKLRVEDEGGHSFGTGTVIDVHGQEGLVLTCGHIFRSSQGKGRIVIERFDSTVAAPTTGTLISYDIDRDVALVSMKLSQPIAVASLAPLQYQSRPGEPIYSIGCNQGQPPTVVRGRVNQIDKYLGPPNITASGRPVVGRSGGGLFNQQGQLIGVCSAADPTIDEGLYAALPRVYYELDRNGLSFVYQRLNQPAPRVEPASRVEPAPRVAMNDRTPSTTLPATDALAPTATLQHVPSTFVQPKSLAEPSSPASARELVCVLKNEDGTESRAYVIEDPSQVLLEYLQREAKQPAANR